MYAIIFCVLCQIQGRCVGVTDGDTISVLVDGQQVKVRLAGIDSPERKQPFGTQAKSHLASLVHEKDVKIASAGRDRYGRTLGVVFVGETNVNEAMIASGFAWVYTRYDRSPRLIAIEQDARCFRLGLWADAEPVPPWVWRKFTSK